jgi:hypothetical protein
MPISVADKLRSPLPRSGILKKFRPQPARLNQPPSKLVPGSATKTTGLRPRGGDLDLGNANNAFLNLVLGSGAVPNSQARSGD